MRIRYLWIMMLGITSLAYGQVELGVDLYNRYVWRGTDFGNSASIQPSLAYSMGPVTIGAWGAWSVSGVPGGNENDLFISSAVGPVELTLTDYFFPGYTGNDGILSLETHIIEVSGGFELGPVATLVAMNVFGDDDNSAYLEFAYGPVTLGMGNGFYTVKDDPDFNLVSIAVSAQRDVYSVSYIFNPEQETSFLVFGISL